MSCLPAGFAAPSVPIAKAQPVSLSLTNSGSAMLKAVQANNVGACDCSSASGLPLGSTEYLTNGTFDNNATGWTPANIDNNGGYRNPGDPPATGANSGGFFVLNDNGNPSTDPTLSQPISGLTAGTCYQINGIYRNYDFRGIPGIQAFAIDLDGVQKTTFLSPGRSWVPFSYRFTATAATQTLAFRAEINGTDINIAVDNLSVRQLVSTPPTTPDVTVAPPANSLYTGGVPTNLFIGYGPQSVTLMPTPQLGVTYSWTPMAGLTFPGGIATFTITNSTNPGSYTFTVTATNQCGATSINDVTITVINALCNKHKDDKHKAKILICHKGKTKCTSYKDVAKKLTKDGDKLGQCAGTSTHDEDDEDDNDDKKRTIDFAVYPNPATDLATVSFRAPQDGPVRVELYNGMGLVSTIYAGSVRSGQLYSFPLKSQHLAKGLYVCRLTIDGKTEMVRLDVAQ